MKTMCNLHPRFRQTLILFGILILGLSCLPGVSTAVSAAMYDTSMVTIDIPAAAPDIWDGTIAAGFASGTGTEADPYIIETPKQLAYLASSVNAGTSYEGKYIRLANDIVLNETDGWENWGTTVPSNMWTPIGGQYIPIPYSITSSTQFNNALAEYGVSTLYSRSSSGSYSSRSSYTSSYSQYYYRSAFSGTFDGNGHVFPVSIPTAPSIIRGCSVMSITAPSKMSVSNGLTYAVTIVSAACADAVTMAPSPTAITRARSAEAITMSAACADSKATSPTAII